MQRNDRCIVIIDFALHDYFFQLPHNTCTRTSSSRLIFTTKNKQNKKQMYIVHLLHANYASSLHYAASNSPVSCATSNACMCWRILLDCTITGIWTTSSRTRHITCASVLGDDVEVLYCCSDLCSAVVCAAWAGDESCCDFELDSWLISLPVFNWIDPTNGYILLGKIQCNYLKVNWVLVTANWNYWWNWCPAALEFL